MKNKRLKNNSSIDEIKEFLRSTPAAWVGKTGVTGQYIMILALAQDKTDVAAPFCVSVSSLGVELRYLKEFEFGKSMAIKLIPELIPGVTSKTNMSDGSVLAYDPSFLRVEGDLNEEFQAKEYKYLPKTYVEKSLDAMGVDRTLYTYTMRTFKCKLNSSAFSQALKRGYSNYDPEVLKFMHNTPGYAAMNVSESLMKEVMAKLDNGEHLILQGPAGAGKSTAICAILSKLEIPFIRIAGHLNMTPDELVGSQAIDRTGLVKFIEAALALCARLGMVLVFDEGDTAYSCWSIINGVTDGSKYLQLSNGEPQAIDPNFRMVITMNPGVSQPLPPSTRTRFGIITFDLPTEEQFTSWLQHDINGTENVLSSRFYKAFYETYINVANLCASERRNVHVAERGFARFLKEIIVYEEECLNNKKKSSVDMWIKWFNHNCYADTLITGQDIDELQKDDYVKVSKPWVEKLFNIFHEDLEDEDEDGTVGEFIIDTAIPTNIDDIEKDLAEMLGEDVLGFASLMFNTFTKAFKKGRK